MNSQFSPQNNLQQTSQQLQSTNQQPPTHQNNIQYYPIIYIQADSFPMSNVPQFNRIEHNNFQLICHPVMPDDPFYSYLSHVSNIIQKSQTQKTEILIKSEDDQDAPKPITQNQISQSRRGSGVQQQKLPQIQKQIKIKAMIDHSKESNFQPCNCSQSNCLKRYCACFHSNKMCSDQCQCKDCKNIELFSQEREFAINHVFKKCHRDKNVPVNELLSLQISYGCKCKATGCQKKYCECFKRGQTCGNLCSCEDCLNYPFNLINQDKLRKKINIQK
ncbi:unnamed protein product [Paramecium sonneborni]|uniref:CRC domain-containing protein n=1 Tax=Paramecium sonneborni TaxID=65129 RepID=A0A8S1L2Y5_9CILI|nr:unnamed protein product [Paramecium sonneborni]